MAVNNTIPIPVPPTMGGTGFTTATTGDTIYCSSTNVWSKLAKGTAGQVYQMNAGATLPAWSSNLIGTPGGRYIYGGDATGEYLTISSTSHATKGKVIFGNAGTTAYDELNGRLGIGTASPNNILEILGTTPQLRVSFTGGSAYALLSVDTNGHITLSHTGSQITIGNGAGASATSAVALGNASHARGDYSIAIGHAADASTTSSGIAIGYVADSDSGGIAIGAGSQAVGSGSVAIGPNVVSAANQFVCGGITTPITNVYFSEGVTNASPIAWALNGTGGSGTDISGGDFALAPGIPTGAGLPGNLLVKFAPAAASSATPGTLATYADWRIGGLMIGTSGAAGRMLEVRSTSAQVRGSYDATNYWEIAADSAGGLNIYHSGNRLSIGAAAVAGANYAIGIGYTANAGDDTGDTGAIAIGGFSVANYSNAIALGYGASTGAFLATCIGYTATSAAHYGIALGYTATIASGASYGIAIGHGATVNNLASIALGYSAVTTATNQFVCGGASNAMTNVFFGKGVTDATPTAWTLNGTGGSGTDISGGDFIVAPGKPTGAGNPGNFLIQFAPAGASGTTLRTLATYADWRISGLMLGTSGASSRMLEVRDTTNPQLRLSSGTGSNYSDLQDVSGLLQFVPGGVGIAQLFGTAPQFRLKDSDTTGSSAFGIYEFYDSAGTRSGYIGYSGSGYAMQILNQQAGPINFYTTNSLRATIAADGNVAIGASPGSATRLGIAYSPTDASVNQYGLDTTFTTAYTTGGPNFSFGQRISATYGGSVSGTLLHGITVDARANHSAGTLTDIRTIYAQCRSTSAGAVTNMTAGRFELQSTGGAATTLGMALYLHSPQISGGSTIASNHGLFIANQGHASVTTSYGLILAAQSGSATNWALACGGGNSYHVGALMIGAASAAARTLEVQSASAQTRWSNTTSPSTNYVELLIDTGSLVSLVAGVASPQFTLQGTSGSSGPRFLWNSSTFDIFSTSPRFRLFDQDTAGSGALGYVEFYDSTSTRSGYIGYAGSGYILSIINQQNGNIILATNNVTRITLADTLLSLASGVDLQMGGNEIYGNTTSGGSLALISTSHATKGTTYIGSSTMFAVDEALGTVGIGGTPISTNKLYTQLSHSENTAYTVNRSRMDVAMTTGSNFTTSQYAMNAITIVSGTDNWTGGTIYAQYAQVSIGKSAGSGNIARAVIGTAGNTGAAAVTTLVGVTGLCVVSSSGNVTNGWALNAGSPTLSSTGVLTNAVGLYVSDQGNATLVTNSYGIYIANQTTSATATWGFASAHTGNHYSLGKWMFGAAAAPTGILHVRAAASGDVVQTIETTTSGDDPIEYTRQYRVTTTNATVTTLATIALTASKTYMIEAKVVARRTGGAGGTAEDGAGYIVVATFNTLAGVATLIGAVAQDVVQESQAGWDCTIDSDGAGNARIRVTGATNNNVTWHAHVRTMEVGS